MKLRLGSLFGFLYREIREVVAPVSKEGIKLNRCYSLGYTSAEDFEEADRPEEYTPSTVIIHGVICGVEYDGWAEWELDVPKHIRKRLIDMILKVDTIRTHGVLHSPDKGKSAEIWVNGRLLDRIYLASKLPHGDDYGVDSRRPVPIFRYIDEENDTQTIKLWVEKGVFWDVDRVSLEPVIKRKELRPEAAMIIGAIITAFIGAIVGLYL